MRPVVARSSHFPGAQWARLARVSLDPRWPRACGPARQARSGVLQGGVGWPGMSFICATRSVQLSARRFLVGGQAPTGQGGVNSGDAKPEIWPSRSSLPHEVGPSGCDCRETERERESERAREQANMSGCFAF